MLELPRLPQYNTLMSAEFFIPHNDDSIETAVDNMEKTMRQFNYVAQYAQVIQDIYASFPRGDEELGKMVHAAQYIANRGTDDASEEVQAVYYGELLGLEFINHLKPDDGIPYKTGFAESFIQFHICLDQLSNAEQSTEEASATRLSVSIQKDLSQPMQEHGLKPIYEEFGQKATSKLSDEPAHQELAMMGFRMIVTEALKQKLPPRTIADLEKEYVPSIQETEDIIGNQEEFQFPAWKDISYIRKIIYNNYRKVSSTDGEDKLTNASTIASIDKYIENRLTRFIYDNDLISIDDLLSVKGRFYGTSDEGRQFLYNEFTEVRGVFEGIHVVETPSNRFLHKQFDPKHATDTENDTGHLIASIAVRLIYPKFIFENEAGIEKLQPNNENSIDIPLNYTAVTFKRLETIELEPEA